MRWGHLTLFGVLYDDEDRKRPDMLSVAKSDPVIDDLLLLG